MKEIAVTASSGKHDNELIGRTMIILKKVRHSFSKSYILHNQHSILFLCDAIKYLNSLFQQQDLQIGIIWRRETKPKVVALC